MDAEQAPAPAAAAPETAPAAPASGQAARRGPLRYAGRIAAIAVAVLFVGLLTYGVLSKASDTTVDDKLRNAEAVPAPTFDLPVIVRGDVGPRLRGPVAQATSGGRLDLGALRGTPVVLNFWASWCIPCRQEAPALEQAWRAARPRGVLFLGLNMQDLTDDARAFARSVGMDYPSVRDRSNEVAREYGATGIPETFFIDRRGRIVGHVVGAVTTAQLAEGAAAAAAGRVVGVQAGGERRETR